MLWPLSFSSLARIIVVPLSLVTFSSATSEVDRVEIDVTRAIECNRKTQSGDQIEVNYKGTLVDGTVFDSSYTRHETFTFTLGIHEVIQGWDDGLLDMCVGEARKLTIPPSLGYGASGAGSVPPEATLCEAFKALGTISGSNIYRL